MKIEDVPFGVTDWPSRVARPPRRRKAVRRKDGKTLISVGVQSQQ